MGVNSGLYEFVLILHIVAAIIGFGAVFVAVFLGLQARDRKGEGGLAVAEATYGVITKVGEWPIYAVPVLGIFLVLLSDDVFKFSQAWISLSFLLYIVAVGLVHGLHLPNIRRMNQLMAELVAGTGAAAGSGPPPQVAELESRGKKAGAVAGALNLLWVLVVVLMVTKPGL